MPETRPYRDDLHRWHCCSIRNFLFAVQRIIESFNHFWGLDDPLARGDACNGISARCDLNPHKHVTCLPISTFGFGRGCFPLQLIIFAWNRSWRMTSLAICQVSFPIFRKWQVSYDCFGAIDKKIAQWRPTADDLSFLAVPRTAMRFALMMRCCMLRPLRCHHPPGAVMSVRSLGAKWIQKLMVATRQSISKLYCWWSCPNLSYDMSCCMRPPTFIHMQSSTGSHWDPEYSVETVDLCQSEADKSRW